MQQRINEMNTRSVKMSTIMKEGFNIHENELAN
jgi:hypothetical protein